MFKYPKAQAEVKKTADEKPPESKIPAEVVPPAPKKDVSPEALRELLEKNLKWSQIIYEQTRKINSKLFWKSVWGWAMLLIFVIGPTALGIWYLPPLVKNLQNQYQPLLSLFGGGGGQTTSPKSAGSMEDILRLLPLGDEQKAMLKGILQPK